MGTQSSKSQEEKKSTNEISDLPCLIRESSSSYQGVRSETTDSNRKSVSGGSTTSEKFSEKREQQEQKMPTLFEWKEGGNIVYITGSFCGWTQFFIMTKQPNGLFQLTLDLQKGFHQYKFKVDNEWRYSNHHPIITDNNNINNCVDTTNAVIPIKENPTKAKTEDKDNQQRAKLYRKQYLNYYPEKTELNTFAPPLPLNYNPMYNIHNASKQTSFGKKYLDIQLERTLHGENNSSKTISPPLHVNL